MVGRIVKVAPRHSSLTVAPCITGGSAKPYAIIAMITYFERVLLCAFACSSHPLDCAILQILDRSSTYGPAFHLSFNGILMDCETLLHIGTRTTVIPSKDNQNAHADLGSDMSCIYPCYWIDHTLKELRGMTGM